MAVGIWENTGILSLHTAPRACLVFPTSLCSRTLRATHALLLLTGLTCCETTTALTSSVMFWWTFIYWIAQNPRLIWFSYGSALHTCQMYFSEGIKGSQNSWLGFLPKFKSPIGSFCNWAKKQSKIAITTRQDWALYGKLKITRQLLKAFTWKQLDWFGKRQKVVEFYCAKKDKVFTAST